MFFSWLDRVMGLWRKTVEVKCLYHSKGPCFQHDLSRWCYFDPYLAEVIFARFLHCPATFSPLSILCSLEAIAKHTHTQGAGIRCCLLEGKDLHELFGILLYVRFVSSSHLFTYSSIYFCQCGLEDIYFILWITIQCYSMYLVAQIVPVLAIGSPFSLASYSITFEKYWVAFYLVLIYILD